jgi:hypothetical protein
MSAYSDLSNYTDSFIREHKKVTPDGYQLDVDDFKDGDLEEFAAQLINYESHEKYGWDWIFDDAYREELVGQFAHSILDWRNKEDAQKAFFDSLKKTAVKTHRKAMQSWIDDRIGDVESEDDYEAKHPSDSDDWEDAA